MYLDEAALNMPASRSLFIGRWAFLALALGLVPAWFMPSPEWMLVCLVAWDVALLVVFWVDSQALRDSVVDVARSLPGRLVLGEPVEVEITLENLSSRKLHLQLADDPPPALLSDSLTFSATLYPGQVYQHRIRLMPALRGQTELGSMMLRRETRLGLARVQHEVLSPVPIQIVPCLHAPFTLRSTGHTATGSVVRHLHASQGTEVMQLRTYTPQDSLRTLDWKATARHRKPIARQFQAEQNQNLWLLLDASRTMATPLNAHVVHSQSRFDIAVTTALSLAAAALDAGDRVGLMTYDSRCLSLVKPQRGRSHFKRLFHTLTGAQAQRSHLSVRGLLAELALHERRRSLVLFFTDLENEAHGLDLTEHAAALVRRHLFVCVSLHDSETPKVARREPTTEAGVYQQAAAIDLVSQREHLEHRLSARGVTVLEADERGLSRKVLAHYLHIKKNARL